ncbi:Glutathione s-transferase [Neofusicoccum parvum]|uniref:Glutathione s-transferase n=1 Tax=Neofusicoccum parvum TaxID=310453 RepID=A0ACB5S7Z5_9PEZI|nr:Glutathione s-transferase [Neofusicoccum parvum]GME64492.1 Glutathione s-transferase [Neofusicoccum parvum]
MSRPSGLIANKGIELLTFGTPNGHKASILLEELKEKYGLEYTFQSINIMENIQKEPWFTKLGPNGRIPVIVDHDNDSFPVQEGAAILAYLTRHHDPEHHFTFADPKDLSRAEQWVAWQHGGVGPMQGQANHFYRLAKERIPYPTQRYVGETERLYGILDSHLADRDYIVGPGRGKYSIADIANFSWINVAYFAGVDLDQFPNLHKWWERVEARPAVRKGTSVPTENGLINRPYKERLQTDAEFKKSEEKLAEICRKAKEQYGYKYSSP